MKKTQILNLGDYLWANQFPTFKPKIKKERYVIFGTLFVSSLTTPGTTTPLLALLPWVRNTPQHENIRERIVKRAKRWIR